MKINIKKVQFKYEEDIGDFAYNNNWDSFNRMQSRNITKYRTVA